MKNYIGLYLYFYLLLAAVSQKVISTRKNQSDRIFNTDKCSFRPTTSLLSLSDSQNSVSVAMCEGKVRQRTIIVVENIQAETRKPR